MSVDTGNVIAVWWLGEVENRPGNCERYPTNIAGYCQMLYAPVPLVQNVASRVKFIRRGLVLTLCVGESCSSYSTAAVVNKYWTGLDFRVGCRYSCSGGTVNMFAINEKDRLSGQGPSVTPERTSHTKL